MGIFDTMIEWAIIVGKPDKELWYLWPVGFLLTIAWMRLGPEEIRRFLNNAGGVFIFGPLALLVASGMMGPLQLFGYWVYSLWTGYDFFSLMWWLQVAAVGILLFIFSFAKGAVTLYLGIVKKVFIFIWSKHEHAQKSPNLGYLILGGLMIALIFNGGFAFRLTEKKLVEGLIPGLSALMGLIAIGRTAFGQKVRENLTEKLSHAPRASDEAWKCIHEGDVYPVLKDGKLILNPDGGYRKSRVKCPGPAGAYAGWNPKEAPVCLRCGGANPFFIRKCTKCGWEGEDKKGFRREVFGHNQKCRKCGQDHPAPKVGFAPMKSNGDPLTPVATQSAAQPATAVASATAAQPATATATSPAAVTSSLPVAGGHQSIPLASNALGIGTEKFRWIPCPNRNCDAEIDVTDKEGFCWKCGVALGADAVVGLRVPAVAPPQVRVAPPPEPEEVEETEEEDPIEILKKKRRAARRGQC